jgi:cytochrome P450
MDYLLVAVAALIVTASSIGFHLLTRAKKPCPAKLPPGSLGLPVIGQTIGLVRAMHANSVDRWIQERIDRYGLVSKLSLFCTPAVLLAGTEANQFVFFCSMLPVWRPRSFQRIIGEKNMMNLYGDDHRRIRGAVMELLKHDMHRLYVRRMDSEVRRHLEKNWAGRTPVTVLPLMKRLALDIICALLFGLEPGAMRDSLAADLVRMLEGTIAIPVNLPFTAFGRSLKASGRVRRLLSGIVREKKAKLEQGKSAPTNDLISRLLGLTDNQGQQLLTNDEIVDNSMLVLLAGHDTTSLLMTFMVRHLANDPDTLAAMVQGN